MTRYALDLPEQLKEEAETYAAMQGVDLDHFILWALAEKVAALRVGIDDPEFPEITYRRGPSGAMTPLLRGTGIHVTTIIVAARQWGMTHEQIATEYVLTKRQVDAALAFYQAHAQEIDQAIAAQAALEVHHDETQTSS